MLQMPMSCDGRIQISILKLQQSLGYDDASAYVRYDCLYWILSHERVRELMHHSFAGRDKYRYEQSQQFRSRMSNEQNRMLWGDLRRRDEHGATAVPMSSCLSMKREVSQPTREGFDTRFILLDRCFRVIQ